MAIGLAVTVGALGVLSNLSWSLIATAILAAWMLLLLRRALGPLDRLEAFGPVHAFAVLGMILLTEKVGTQ